MQSIKDCITNYMGFTVGGTAAAIGALLAADTTKVSRDLLCIGSLVLASVATLLLCILIYKFNSHNRYAGYCKLLSHERYVFDTDRQSKTVDWKAGWSALHAWEVCMDRLRESDRILKVLLYRPALRNVKGLKRRELGRRLWELERIDGLDKLGDFWVGVGIIMKSPFSGQRSESWLFPVYVVIVFAAIVLVFVCSAVYLIKDGCSSGLWAWPNLANGILIACLLIAWTRILRAVAVIMQGRGTVDSFCWRFIPIRYRLLEDCGPLQEYTLVGVGTKSRTP